MCATILWMWSLTSILSRSQFFLKRIVFYLIEWITCQLGSLNARLQVIWTSTSCGAGAQKWSSYCGLLLLSLGPRAPDETRKDRLVMHKWCESLRVCGFDDWWVKTYGCGEAFFRTESTALVGLSQVNDIASCHHAPTSLVAVKLAVPQFT